MKDVRDVKCELFLYIFKPHFVRLCRMATIPSLVLGSLFSFLSLSSGTASFFLDDLRETCSITAIALGITGITYLSLTEPYLRWLGYAFACAFLSFETSRVLKKHQGFFQSIVAGITMSSVLFTGFSLYFSTSLAAQILSLVFASLYYLAALLMIGWKIDLKWYYVAHLIFFIFSWSLYPVAYILGPVFLGILNSEQEYYFYFVLEFFSKILVSVINISITLYHSRVLGIKPRNV